MHSRLKILGFPFEIWGVFNKKVKKDQKSGFLGGIFGVLTANLQKGAKTPQNRPFTPPSPWRSKKPVPEAILFPKMHFPRGSPGRPFLALFANLPLKPPKITQKPAFCLDSTRGFAENPEKWPFSFSVYQHFSKKLVFTEFHFFTNFQKPVNFILALEKLKTRKRKHRFCWGFVRGN